MRLVIDLQGAQSASRWRGIGRYSLALAENIAKLKGEHDVIVVLSDAFPETLVALREKFEPIVGVSNVRIWSPPTPVNWNVPGNDDRRKCAEFIFNGFLSSLNPDVILISSLFEGHGDDAVTSVKALDFGIPVAVILYDLIPLHNPDRYLKPSPTWERLYREKISALASADLLLAISSFTANDAVDRLGVDREKVVNISAACSDIFRPSQMPSNARANLMSRLGINGPFIVTSGTIEPHKNLSTLFAAFSLLSKELRDVYRIVMVGHILDSQKIVYQNMLAAAGLPVDTLISTGYVTDEELVAIYTEARLMVFPSMDEGFGLPALEAMSCGTPTIGSDASSVPEVIGLNDAQFSPKDTAGLADLISRGLQDQLYRSALLANASERSKIFSWEKTAHSAIAALDFVAKSKYERGSPKPTDSLSICLDAISQTDLNGADRADIAQALAFNFPEPNRIPKLFVDVSELRLRDVHTGCQRVTRSVLNAWINSPPPGYEVVPVYATSDRAGYFYAHDYHASITGKTTSASTGTVDYAAGDVFFGLDLHPIIAASQKHYLQRMRRRGVLVRFLVYDLLPIQMPEYFPDRTEPAYEAFFETLLVTDGIVGISRSTVDAFRAWQSQRGHITEGRFGYEHVHLGADLENSRPTTGLPIDGPSVLKKLSSRPSFLTVGTIEPRKGNKQVLDAFELLWTRGEDVNLVFVGKAGWNIAELVQRLEGHPERGKRLFWLHDVSDEYLQAIYGATTCLIAASEGEGFGLPLIEAAQAGLPILARDINVFREVAGANASYFTAEHPSQLSTAIKNWLKSWEDNTAPTSRDLKWLTWSDCAEELGRIVTRPPSFEDSGFVLTQRVKGFSPAKKRILVSKLDHMGDLLLALPALSRLRSRYPEARIDLLCGSWNETQAEQLGLFDTIYTYDFFKKSSSASPAATAIEVEELRKKIGECDLVIDLRRQPDTRFIAAAISAPMRVGYQTGVEGIDKRMTVALPYWYDIQFESTPLNKKHITKQMLELVDAIPAEMNDYISLPPMLSSSPEKRGTAVCFFPKAGNAIKEWGDARFEELAKYLADDTNIDAINIYFSTAAEARDSRYECSEKIHIHVGLSFEELVKSVAQNCVCVANNSFGAHIASYLGVEVIGIYGGHETSAEWAPFFGNNTVLSRPTPCSPCHLPSPLDCPHALRCLDIPVKTVTQEVFKAVNRFRSTAQ